MSANEPETASPRVTIRLIADQLAISTYAVSRALAGKPGVSEATRRQIMMTARSLGYAPRTPAAARPHQIEIILNDHDRVNSESWLAVNRGAQREAARLGYVARMRMVHDVRQIADVAADTCGLIVAGHNSSAVFASIGSLNLPTVYAGGVVRGSEAGDLVRTADQEGGLLAAEHLLALGHRCIVYAHGEAGRLGRIGRLAGLRDVCRDVADAEILEIDFPDNEQGAFVAALKPLLDAGKRPTAFFCGNDVVAVTVVSALQRRGLSVPGDVSVIGYADYSVAVQVEPKLTTVRIPSEDMGVQAVRLLVERCELGPDIAPKRIYLAPRLVVRASTAAAGAPRWQAFDRIA